MQNTISFPEQAKVFVYQSDRFLNDEECMLLKASAEKFASAWMSHGQPVKAEALLLNKCQLVFVVDESNSHVGGCSIDANVHFVKRCGAQLGVDFFNRLVLAFETSGQIALIPIQKVASAVSQGELNSNSRLFDNSVTTFGQWRDSWLKSLEETWLSKSGMLT